MVVKEILLLLVMFWNLENFFDPFEGNSNGGVQSGFVRHQRINDTLRRSGELAEEPFTPQGEKFWTWKKFSKKRDDIAKTVALVGEHYGRFPAVIGLCEVENRFVLQQLAQNTILAKLDYGIIHKDSPDRRGIDAAMLYRKELFSPIKVQFIPILNQAKDTLQSREIVYVKGVFRKLDTLHFFVLHWPSKLGGEKESSPRRMAASNTLKQTTDSILAADCRANVIVMGDFNDNAESESVANLGNLVNISEQERATIGKKELRREPYRWFTYKYRESWSRIDHFLVSENLWEDSSKGYSGIKLLYCTPQSGCVFGHESLLEKDNNYFGYKIRRTLTGPRYNGGVSDHLPIILKVWGYEY